MDTNSQRAQVVVTPWEGGDPPSEDALRAALAGEGLLPYRWSNAPGDVYAAHRHGYDKVLYVVSGTITFGLPASGERMELSAGDRLDLPSGVAHDASVGPEGVVCLEAHRR
jgi:quercetin dioxygenase-like cupin family protein